MGSNVATDQRTERGVVSCFGQGKQHEKPPRLQGWWLLYCSSLFLKFLYRLYSYSHFYMLQVFISIALILGDGLYNFLKISALTARNMQLRFSSRSLKTGKDLRRLNIIQKAHDIGAEHKFFMLHVFI